MEPLLLDYFKSSLQVDKIKGDVTLLNKENVESHIIDKFKKCAVGKYLSRVDLELTADEGKVVRKVPIVNSEKEMSEHLYDIKLF